MTGCFLLQTITLVVYRKEYLTEPPDAQDCIAVLGSFKERPHLGMGYINGISDYNLGYMTKLVHMQSVFSPLLSSFFHIQLPLPLNSNIISGRDLPFSFPRDGHPDRGWTRISQKRNETLVHSL